MKIKDIMAMKTIKEGNAVYVLQAVKFIVNGYRVKNKMIYKTDRERITK